MTKQKHRPIQVMPRVFFFPGSRGQWCSMSEVFLLIKNISDGTFSGTVVDLLLGYAHLVDTQEKISGVESSRVKLFPYRLPDGQPGWFIVSEETSAENLPFLEHIHHLWVDAKWVRELVQCFLLKV